MTILKRWFSLQLHQVPSKVAIGVLLVALIGFADAGYLTVEHFKNVIPPCSITGGCGIVLTSAYSSILGIPVSLIGMIYYLIVAVCLVAFLESKNHKILRFGMLFTILGLLASIWFVSAQAFILHSYCAYCLGSAATSIVLFICAMLIFKKYGTHDLEYTHN